MSSAWQKLKEELDRVTEELSFKCPDEILRFHYGLITHSEAGKYSINQYFGHWVHLYAFYMGYTEQVLGLQIQTAMDPSYSLEQCKDLYRRSSTFGPMIQYGGQYTLGKYADEMLKAIDSIGSKEDFLSLLRSWHGFVSRIYWWVHWYFPWGIGPAAFQRLTQDDVREIVRLSQTRENR